MDPESFYLMKGMTGLLGTVLVVIHMQLSWGQFDRDSNGVRTGITQRARYLSWFLFILYITIVSYKQVKLAIPPPVVDINVGSFFVEGVAAVVALLSIIEARHKLLRRH